MPASLRFALVLFFGGLAAAALALGVAQWQRETRSRIVAEAATGGDAGSGSTAIRRYGCGACHEIPGIPSASGHVGPSLEGFAGRAEIAGLLANNPAELVHWLREPQAVKPGSGMPNQGIDETDARHITAYLLSLD
ncbi:cytochrome c family protein [Aureimonas sp. AU4]|uniref:c-type cytochrome n=1 Tax=Aureimonas sp. AU4 TaxID=1638163 RepID=UPI00192CF7B2|nr:c-type cytochrome [Aureimonas sp. AU4]